MSRAPPYRVDRPRTVLPSPTIAMDLAHRPHTLTSRKETPMSRRVALRAVAIACLGLNAGCFILTLCFCLLRLR